MTMRLSLTARADAAPNHVSAFDGLLFIAIICTGAAAASIAMPMLWIVTPVVATLVYVSARCAARPPMPVVDDGELPMHVQLALDEAIDRLPLGEARQLLANIVRQARPLFAQRESSFDAAMVRGTRDDVIDLVTAACETALELWRLDGAAPISSNADDLLRGRYSRARVELVARLESAAVSLSELYASDVEHGTPASDRVADLAISIRDDARSRSAAKDEIDGVVGQRTG